MESIGLKAILEDSNFQAGLKRYQNGIGQMEKSTERAASILSKAGAVMQGAFVAGIGAATLSIGAFVAASKIGLDATLAWSEGLDKLGDQFGLTGEQGSAFQFLANKVGVSVDEMGFGLNSITNGLQGVEDRLKSGSKTLSPFEQGLSKIGVSAFNSKGKLKTFDELLPDLMDAFNKLPPGIKASSVAMDLFGTRGGGKFLDFLRQGSKGLDEARKKAKALGLELSTDEVNAAEEFGFAMNELNLGIKGFWNQIGRQVLPIVRRFVDFVNVKIIPVLSKLAKDYMPKIARVVEDAAQAFGQLIESLAAGDLESGIGGFVSMLLQAIGASEEFSIKVGDAFAGVAKSIQDIVNAFKADGLVGGLQAIGTQLTNAFKNIDWAAVSKNLEGLKSKFWTWLTGEGGVLSQVGTQLGKVRDAIAAWLGNSANTRPIVDAILGEKGLVVQFWTWVTDPNKGLLVTVATEMGKLVDKIKEWSELEDTKVRFRKIGETIANTILEGIGNLFSNPGEGRNLLIKLSDTIRSAYNGLRNVFVNIGGDIAHGIVIDGIVSKIVSPEMATQIGKAFDDVFHVVLSALSAPGGPIMWFASKLAQGLFEALKAAWSSIFGSWNPLAGAPTPAPTTPAPAPTPPPNNWNTKPKPIGWFDEGGPVRRTGMAMVHAGEFVLNRQQAMAWAPALASTSNVYNFNHTWPAAVPPSQREWTESMVRRVTQQEVRGILGKG